MELTFVPFVGGDNNGCIDMYDSWVSVPAFCYRIKQSNHLAEIYNGVLFKYGN